MLPVAVGELIAMGKKNAKGKLGIVRETLQPLQFDSLDGIIGGNATVSGLSRWTHNCLTINGCAQPTR
jgi:hypothetical protein